uniref:FlgO domain-containing protein n=1 Tax=uncultured bacterium contig00004 TaxID=1181496 RepID=A0A806JYH3_9BACT|nr:hypothetical protein [uncultured bacterium contig00004]
MIKCFLRVITIFSVIFAFMSCGTAPPATQNVTATTGGTSEQSSSQQRLEEVIRNAARVVESSLSQGNIVAIVSFRSFSELFSDYVIEELTGEFVRNRRLTVVDRSRLDPVRQRMNLSLSGEINEQTAQTIGRQVGAQYIITGNLIRMGNYYRFIVNIMSVESAAMLHQISFNLQNNQRVAFLLGETPEVEEMPVEAPLPPPVTLPEDILPVVENEKKERVLLRIR